MSGDCRTSHDLKSIFDNLDKRDDGKGGLEDDDGIRESDVATEAEAIKREAAASRVGTYSSSPLSPPFLLLPLLSLLLPPSRSS